MTPRQSKLMDILWIIDSPEGKTAKELTSIFPRKTVYRHLKTLLEKGWIQKVRVDRAKGQKGRQPVRYKTTEGRMCVSIPAKWIGKTWYPAKRITRLGQSHVRLSGKWLEEYQKDSRKGVKKNDEKD